MIADLKPYPEYKESGSRWLAEVPDHWEVRNLRTLIRPRTERNRADLPLLSVAREKGVFVRSLTDPSENHNVIPEDLSNYKVARGGDLVINKMKAWQGSMGIAPCDGIVSPAYYVFDFGIENAGFGQKLLRSKPYVAHFGQASDGVRVGQWDLSIPGMRLIPVLVPPPAEQAAIVRFLDHWNGRLEKAIRSKRRVIALLQEQKQAIIHRAVTRGLDPNVKLKDSGIPWLGDIPVHWEVQRLKRVCRVQGGYAFPASSFGETGTPVVRMNNLRRGVLDFGNVARIPETECVQAFALKTGDILYGLSGSIGATGSLGNYAVVAEHDLPAMLNQRIARFAPKLDRIDPNFLVQLIQSSIFYEQVLADTTGTAQFNVSTNDIENVAVGLPPISEQASLVLQVNERVAPLATAITRYENEITLLREYRTRLTADVVTGKLDIRAAAAQLPDPEPDEAAVQESAIEEEPLEESPDEF